MTCRLNLALSAGGKTANRRRKIFAATNTHTIAAAALKASSHIAVGLFVRGLNYGQAGTHIGR